MNKPHCDNCDELILPNAKQERLLTIQPWGFQCLVKIVVEKPNVNQTMVVKELCARCLHAAAIGFANSITEAR